MGPIEAFREEVRGNIERLKQDRELQALSLQWVREITPRKYAYNFTWLGRPIIQLPQDIVALQELVWSTRPDLIVETGIAHGGSLILSASLLALLDLCDARVAGGGPGPRRRVVGVDVDIRAHNREAIEAHPLADRIEMIQGSSVDPRVIDQVRQIAGGHERVLVLLDSNHTRAHVLAELEGYAPLVSVGSYCVVFDTVIEDLPAELFGDRPWAPGNSPKTAVREYLAAHPEFALDRDLEAKLQITVAPGGFLRRIA
jgi:cephalosporin hydroxylase